MMYKRIIYLLFLVGILNSACHTNATQSGKTSGQANAQNIKSTPGPLELTFSKSSYGKSDTLKLSILNRSDSNIILALRCGHFLEMSYQESVKGHWSENKELSYMMLKCPTHIHIVKPNERFEFSLPSAMFTSTGTFRLLIPFNIGTENTNQIITSVPFDLR